MPKPRHVKRRRCEVSTPQPTLDSRKWMWTSERAVGRTEVLTKQLQLTTEESPLRNLYKAIVDHLAIIEDKLAGAPLDRQDAMLLDKLTQSKRARP